jgi:hypothetical protein
VGLLSSARRDSAQAQELETVMGNLFGLGSTGLVLLGLILVGLFFFLFR